MPTRFWLVPVLVGCACPLTARGSAGKPSRAAGSASYASFLTMLKHAQCTRDHGGGD